MSRSPFIVAGGIEVDGGPRFTAAELTAALPELAAALRDNAGISAAPVVVAACLEPWQALIVVLAALEAELPVAVEWADSVRDVARELPGRALVVGGVTAELKLEPRSLERRATPGATPPSGTALLVATSGSTGAPRWAAFDVAGVRAAIQRILGYLPIVAGERIAITSPLQHAYGLVGQGLVALAGGATVVFPKADATAAELLARFVALDATAWSTVPLVLSTVARAAAEAGAPWRPRWLASAGAPLHASVAREVAGAFPGTRLFDQYGLTEAGPRVAAIDSSDPAFAAGSVGPPLPGVDLWIDDGGRRAAAGHEGEVCLRGEGIMLGYLPTEPPDPVASPGTRLEGGLLYTGDRGWLDERGYLHITGRLDERLKVAGEWVSLDRITRLLEPSFPAAGRAALCALPDARSGYRLTLVVEEADPATAASALARIRTYALGHLRPPERPRHYLALPSLPRTPSGKIDRDLLMEAATRLVDLSA